MDWQNERWVKLYTRSTPSWRMLPWQSRALFPLLLKEVDKAGQIGLGRAGLEGLAAAVGLPIEVVREGVRGLEEDGSVTRGNAVLTVEHFVEAQEAQTSNAERQRRFKERRKLLKSQDTSVTRGNGWKRSEESRGEESRVFKDSVPSAPVVLEPAELVFDHWRTTHRPGARIFDAKTRRVVEARLAEGFTVDELRSAIDGCRASPHHMGANDRGKKYNSLELICRDGSKVTAMLGYLEAGAKAPSKVLASQGFNNAQPPPQERMSDDELEQLFKSRTHG